MAWCARPRNNPPVSRQGALGVLGTHWRRRSYLRRLIRSGWLPPSLGRQGRVGSIENHPQLPCNITPSGRPNAFALTANSGRRADGGGALGRRLISVPDTLSPVTAPFNMRSEIDFQTRPPGKAELGQSNIAHTGHDMLPPGRADRKASNERGGGGAAAGPTAGG